MTIKVGHNRAFCQTRIRNNVKRIACWDRKSPPTQSYFVCPKQHRKEEQDEQRLYGFDHGRAFEGGQPERVVSGRDETKKTPLSTTLFDILSYPS